MKPSVLPRIVLLSGMVLFLASCKPGKFSTGRAGFKANYLVARAALESGQYDRAVRQYRALLKDTGPLEMRIRLEEAHALLRNGKFDRAVEAAQLVATHLTGAGRSAALAVQGTADHEAARSAVLRGKAGAAELKRMQSAQAALSEVLSINPELDPTGAMKSRLAQIELELRMAF